MVNYAKPIPKSVNGTSGTIQCQWYLWYHNVSMIKLNAFLESAHQGGSIGMLLDGILMYIMAKPKPKR